MTGAYSLRMFIVFFVVFLWGRIVYGQENAAIEDRPIIQFGVTPTFVLSPNSFCERDSDMVGCGSGLFTTGFQVDGHYRFPFGWLGVGVVSGANFELNQVESCTSDGGCIPTENAYLWRAAVEARFVPVRREKVAFWLALEGGVVGCGGRAFRDVTGEGGVGFGVDLLLGRCILFGFDIRALFYGFGTAPVTTPDGGKVQITNSAWLSFGLLKLGARFSL